MLQKLIDGASARAEEAMVRRAKIVADLTKEQIKTAHKRQRLLQEAGRDPAFFSGQRLILADKEEG